MMGKASIIAYKPMVGLCWVVLYIRALESQGVVGSRCRKAFCLIRCQMLWQAGNKFTQENPNVSVLVESKRTDKVDADNTNMT